MKRSIAVVVLAGALLTGGCGSKQGGEEAKFTAVPGRIAEETTTTTALKFAAVTGQLDDNTATTTAGKFAAVTGQLDDNTATTTTGTTWVKVATFAGSGSLNGEQFALQGGQQRVTWECSMPVDGGAGSSSFNVWNLTTSYKSGGPFDCDTRDAVISGSGHSMDYLVPGTYYFKVNATPNHTWSVTVEELR